MTHFVVYSSLIGLLKFPNNFIAVPLLAACVFLLTKQAFKLSLRYFQKIIKQLLNSSLAGYEELLRPRFELLPQPSASAPEGQTRGGIY